MPADILAVAESSNMFGEKYIRFDSVSVHGRKVVFRFSCSKRLKKYLSSDTFYVEYDALIDDVSKSILAVPAIAAFIPLAWATGANIYVQDELSELLQHEIDHLHGIIATMRAIDGSSFALQSQRKYLTDGQLANSFKEPG